MRQNRTQARRDRPAMAAIRMMTGVLSLPPVESVEGGGVFGELEGGRLSGGLEGGGVSVGFKGGGVFGGFVAKLVVEGCNSVPDLDSVDLRSIHYIHNYGEIYIIIQPKYLRE